MLYSELLGIARTGKIGPELSFHFIIMLGSSGRDTGH